MHCRHESSFREHVVLEDGAQHVFVLGDGGQEEFAVGFKRALRGVGIFLPYVFRNKRRIDLEETVGLSKKCDLTRAQSKVCWRSSSMCSSLKSKGR